MDMSDLKISPSLTKPFAAYTFSNPRHQNFSFRWPIIKFILKNPTGKSWKKLIKTCKYFFPKYPLYPVKDLKYYCCVWTADGKIIDPKKFTKKLWLFDVFYYDYCLVLNHFPKFVSKVANLDLRFLSIYQKSLTLENYQMLTSSSSLKILHLFSCSFKYSDGNDVKMDKLLENLPHLEELNFVCEARSKTFENDTIKKMDKILSSLKSMHYFKLAFVEEYFDLSLFMDFLMKNETIHVHLFYNSGLRFSDAYGQMLENCFEELVANPPKKLPQITIYWYGSKKYREYRKIYYNPNKKTGLFNFNLKSK